MINVTMVKKWIQYLDKEYTQNKDMLTQLDSAIGDADHGINMARGFKVASIEIENLEFQDLSSIMKKVSMALIKNVGGASGPLYGTLFMKLGNLKLSEATLEQFTEALTEAVEAIKKLGKSDENEKTMLDVWCPVVNSLKNSIENKRDMISSLQNAVQAANEGAASTIHMVAKKGRASFLGERSVGHRDPGAESSRIMVEQAAKAFI